MPYETGFPGIHDENTVADSSVPRKQDSAVNRDYDVIALSPGVPLRGIVVFHGRIRPRRATSFLPEEEGIQALNGVVDPCDMAITSENKEFIRFVIASHANFSFQVEGATPRVERGDLFEVTLPISYNGSDRGIQGTIPVNKKIKGKNPLVSLSDALACQSLQETFAEEDASSLGELSDGKWSELVNRAPYVSDSGVIIGTPPLTFLNIASYVTTEQEIWKGKIETDSSVQSALDKYWKVVGKSPWNATEDPWSAAFVSYIMTKVDPAFPKSVGHYYYASSAQASKGAWTLWDINKGNIKAQLGDILIQDKSTPESPTAGHGDVVYKIDGSTAYLTGGNLGNTMSTSLSVTLTSEGYYKSVGSYIIVLKKRGKVQGLTIA